MIKPRRDVLAQAQALALTTTPVLSALGPLALLATPLARAATSEAGKLPTAAVRNVPETFFGTSVDDPYRDFEDTKAPAVAAWMKAQSDFAHATLKRIAGRDALRAKLEQYDSAAAARMVAVQRLPGDLYFFERRGAKEDQFKLYLRRGISGSDKLLFDPETLKKKTGKPHAINCYSASPDGKLVALGVSAAGSEDASLRIIDTATGRQRGPEITRAQFGGVSWAPDGRELYFHRMQALAKGAPPTDKYQRSSTVAMKPGASEGSIRTVLTAGVDLGIPATEFPLLEVLPGGRVLASATDGVWPDFAAWHTTLTALRAGKPAWQKLVGPAWRPCAAPYRRHAPCRCCRRWPQTPRPKSWSRARTACRCTSWWPPHGAPDGTQPGSRRTLARPRRYRRTPAAQWPHVPAARAAP